MISTMVGIAKWGVTGCGNTEKASEIALERGDNV